MLCLQKLALVCLRRWRQLWSSPFLVTLQRIFDTRLKKIVACCFPLQFLNISEKNAWIYHSAMAAKIWYLKNVRFLLVHPVECVLCLSAEILVDCGVLIAESLSSGQDECTREDGEGGSCGRELGTRHGATVCDWCWRQAAWRRQNYTRTAPQCRNQGRLFASLHSAPDSCHLILCSAQSNITENCRLS